ncbi:hypothetical protein FA15DRAFT_705702 [Coprinopsis marcescibilis]|uniref:Uncharacterized protein n=1 Tax=Coprinopsis marcescibilis TaxID=230819 RepID=A0A5C3KRA7_COPMA|nr:hypothetical protein FA15DRAFT_705702 [Coprinopsis marcescibilis]
MFSSAARLGYLSSRQRPSLGLFGLQRQYSTAIVKTPASTAPKCHRLAFNPTHCRRSQSTTATTEKSDESKAPQVPVAYEGPLSNTWRKLKLFSLASFGFSTTLAPFMFVVESGLPYSARFALASLAVGTSGVSTSLVSWCAKPYVTTLRRYTPEDNGGQEVLELTTMTLMLRPRVTTVYDPAFLVETRRPMAKWELAREITHSASAGGQTPAVGTQETIAETADHNGQIIGRWVVEWREGGIGTCHEAGTVVRHFNVHEELLN